MKGVECYRVYDSPASRNGCHHRHKSFATAQKCAKSMSFGWWSAASGRSWVEVRPFGDCGCPPHASDCPHRRR